ncbi:Uncharacterised protein [Streptococcus pneumoniae]|nr:Uncharacterised protein [Streptococcus pneumoniae]CIW26056.1 Uncharacterised protein [Streptococcus pneumoniae]
MFFCYLFDKDEKQTTSRFRIVVGHVVMFQGHTKTLGQRPQTMAFILRIEVSSKLQRINNWLTNLWKIMPLIISIHKANVKGSIVGN